MAWEEVTIGQCRLIRGDALEVLPTLGLVHAVVTDPPYGLGLGRENNRQKNGGYGCHLGKKAYLSYDDSYENFCTSIIPRLNLALDLAPVAAVFTGPHIHEQRKPDAIGGIFLPQAGGRTSWGSKNFLPVLFYGNPPGAGQHRPTVIQDASRPEPSIHPCPKPLSYMRWLVNLATRQGNIVVDPFAGSGTTAVACLQLGRACICIEVEPVYFDESCSRIEQAYKQLDLFQQDQVKKPEQLVLA